MAQADPRALKSFALASHACHAAESQHRQTLRPLHADLLPAALAWYTTATCLYLTLCMHAPTPPSP
jgi:F-box and leucine-rich repeat protein 2/20